MMPYCASETDCPYRTNLGYCAHAGQGCAQEGLAKINTVKVPAKPKYTITQLVDLSDESIEKVADAVVKKLHQIDELPSARPKGKWIRVDGSAHGIVSRVVKCSLCNKNAGLSEEYFWHLSKFCPNCGAKMDAEGGEEA